MAEDDRPSRLVEHLNEVHVEVHKAKLDGWSHTHRARVVCQDESGIWLFAPAGTASVASDGRVAQLPADGVQFFPSQSLPHSGGWFVAWFWAATDPSTDGVWGDPWISVDIAEQLPEPVSFLDLELDLWCSSSEVGIVDQDELDEAVERGLIEPEVARTAERAALEVEALLTPGLFEVFGGLGWRLLREARGRDASQR